MSNFKKAFILPLSLTLLLAACDQKEPPETDTDTNTPAQESAVAPFIDTQRTATMLGGSTEWSYTEGLAFDEKSRTVYYALSKVSNKMSDGAGDIRMDENICGGIFAAKLDANWQLSAITPVLMGVPEGKGCSNDAIANPDNIYTDAKGRLWIGEDTSKKANNMLWRFDPTSGELKRFASLPTGAEVAGLYITEAGELFLNVQHPDSTSIAPFDKATVGLVHGFNANVDDFTALPVQQGDDGRTLKLASGSYTVLNRSGENGAGVIDNVVGEAKVCENPDGNMPIPQADGSMILYTNFECRPGGVLKQWLKRDSTRGYVVARQEKVNFSEVAGTWRNCNGSVTPWGTALSSEEDAVEADLERWESWSDFKDMSDHLGRPASPWNYGFIIELTPNADGSTQVNKRYAMGRTNWELARVLPDKRTVYLSDDGNSRGLYKFIADRAGDLTSGTLYVARLSQVADASSANGQRLDVKWVKMGHGVESEIAAALKRLDPYKK